MLKNIIIKNIVCSERESFNWNISRDRRDRAGIKWRRMKILWKISVCVMIMTKINKPEASESRRDFCGWKILCYFSLLKTLPSFCFCLNERGNLLPQKYPNFPVGNDEDLPKLTRNQSSLFDQKFIKFLSSVICSIDIDSTCSQLSNGEEEEWEREKCYVANQTWHIYENFLRNLSLFIQFPLSPWRTI